jgi:hypothetical protein
MKHSPRSFIADRDLFAGTSKVACSDVNSSAAVIEREFNPTA